MSAIVHTASGIRDLLRRGLTPITDNAQALVELGFVRAYPQHEHDFEATIWERTVELGKRPLDGRKMLARERAFLYSAARGRGR